MAAKPETFGGLMDAEDKEFAAYLKTLNIDANTLAQAPAKTIVPAAKQRIQTASDLISTLPLLEVGVTLQPSGPGTGLPTMDPSLDLEIHGKIGEGGMGVVHSARQRPLDRMVAVKTTHATSLGAADGLLQEAYVTGVLEHPNVVPIYTLGRKTNGSPMIVMKRIEGVSWLDVLLDPSKAPSDQGHVDLAWHLRVLIQVCDAMRYAHSRGFIHRDIKPENVMLGSFGEVYVLDWGIAIDMKDEGESHLMSPLRSRSKGLAGTPSYMAPEMTLDNAAEVDQRTDVYLLGAVLHEIITGEPRHKGDNIIMVLSSVNKSLKYAYDADVAPELAEIANKATALEKADRFQTVAELSESLQNFLEHRNSVALSTAAQQRLREFERLLTHDSDSETLLAIHDVSAQSKFGFQQALEMWPDNAPALEGLQTCLDLLIRHFIDTGNDIAAAAAFAELPHPVPGLEVEILGLKKRRESELAELAGLRKLQHAVDQRVGAGQRSIMILVLGTLWTASTTMAAFTQLETPLDDPALIQDHFWGSPRVVGIALVLMVLFRKPLMANQINRRFAYSLVLTLLLIVVMRYYAMTVGMSVVNAQSMEFIAYGVIAAFVGLMSDIRLTYFGLAVFWGAAFASVISPPHQLFVMAAAVFVFFAGVAFLWTPGQINKRMTLK